MFRSTQTIAASVLAAGLGLTACSPNHSGANNPGMINTASIMADKNLSPSEKAERLAEASERLMQTSSFFYADDVADSALSIDPTNAKARLIHAVIAPTLELRGIVSRVEPLVRKRPDLFAKYQEFVDEIKRFNPERSFTEFALDGKGDLLTERDVQEVIARFVLRLDDLRKTVRDIKETEMTIYINDKDVQKSALNDAAKACQAVQTSPGVYQLQNCDLSHAYERRMNHADFESIEQMVAGFQVYLTVLNAWDLTGVYTKGASLTSDIQKDLAKLMTNKNFGTLRKTHGMGVMPDIAKDAVLGVRYAISIQDELCPNGNQENVRPGYLFNNGFCAGTSDQMERALGAIELMIKGQPAVIWAPGPNGEDSTTVVNAMAFFTQPIQDLRTLTPISVSKCGYVTQVADATLGGVFPTGDFNRILKQNDNCLSDR